MAQTKLATIRYQALDRCFSNWGRRYFIEDLIKECNKALREYLGEDAGVKRRQVFEDIKFMESESGWSVDLERLKDGKRVYYRYTDRNFSINQRPMSEYEARQLRDTLVMLQRFKGMPNFEWVDEVATRMQATYNLGTDVTSVVSFQNNPYLKGIEFFTPIFNAIINKRTLLIEYQPFDKDQRRLVISPYYLKQYNNRWFLFGRVGTFDNLSNIALDRIVSVSEYSAQFIECPDDIDFEEYFSDVVGVSINMEAPTEDVILRVTQKQAKYIRNKPLHESQRENPEFKDAPYAEFHLSVKDNYELRSLLLSFGGELEVVAPKALRSEMAEMACSLAKLYGVINK